MKYECIGAACRVKNCPNHTKDIGVDCERKHITNTDVVHTGYEWGVGSCWPVAKTGLIKDK